MNTVAALLDDIDCSIERGAPGGRALSQITDLFLTHGGAQAPEQVAIFDEVMQRYARVVDSGARAELAQRLVYAPNPPPNLVRVLAHDEIEVAAPILARAVSLSDQDLAGLALVKGRDHLLAICSRPVLPELVTDVLVSRGDPAVNRAAVGNRGARFSPLGLEGLIEHSKEDGELQEILGARRDLSEAQTQALIAATKESAWRRFTGVFSSEKAQAGTAEPSNAGRRNEIAWAAVARLAETGFLNELQLEAFARERRLAETVAAMSHMTELPSDYIGSLLGQRDNDILLVLARSYGWSWDTAQALLQLRDPMLTSPHQFWHASEVYRTMPTSTAKQAVEFIRTRQRRPAVVVEHPRRRWLRSG